MGSESMRILNLFDMYFLAMMLIQGTVVLAVDVRSFKKTGMNITGRKAHILGWFTIIAATTLFIMRRILA
jgi:hypothetical protein